MDYSAYAWSLPIEGSAKRRLFVVLHNGWHQIVRWRSRHG